MSVVFLHFNFLLWFIHFDDRVFYSLPGKVHWFMIYVCVVNQF